jgi:DNA-binding MarR family transcriptional regulator
VAKNTKSAAALNDPSKGISMTLTELKYIVAVAREKHFGRGAEACHVSQPTLSVAIKKLEEELQVKLLAMRPAGRSGAGAAQGDGGDERRF